MKCREKPGSESWDALGHTLGNAVPANLSTPQDGRTTLGTAMFPDQALPTTVGPVLRNPVAQTMQHRPAMIFSKPLTPPGLVTVTFQHPSQSILASWFLKNHCQPSKSSLHTLILTFWSPGRKVKAPLKVQLPPDALDLWASLCGKLCWETVGMQQHLQKFRVYCRLSEKQSQQQQGAKPALF